MLAIPWASKGKDELQGIYNKPEAALKVQLCVWSDSKIWQLHKCSSLLCSFLKFLVSLHFSFSGDQLSCLQEQEKSLGLKMLAGSSFG